MQHRLAHYTIPHLAVITAVAVLTACAPAPPRPVGDDALGGDPQSAYERGDYRTAAAEWQKRALNVPDNDSARIRLRATDAWILAGDFDNAEKLLEWIDSRNLSTEENALLGLLDAEVAVTHGGYLKAQSALAGVEDPLPARYQARYEAVSELIADILRGPGAAGLRESQGIADSMFRYEPESALRLLKSLESVPSSSLVRHAKASMTGANRAGWLSLALVLRNNLVDAAHLEEQVEQWASLYPEHVVSHSDALDLWLRYRQTFSAPRMVAVLLPASGPLKAAATAVRDGIVSAYIAQPSGAKIRFYDSGGNPQAAIAAYFQAADDGADWIVGPLARQSVAALLNLAGLATPILALNELPRTEEVTVGQLATQAVGLSLSQEREAAAVARKMRETGLEKIVLLAPESAWGEHIAAAFRAEFLHKDEEILVSARYLPEENDHSQMLERILKIDQSKSRKSQLQNRLGLELEFEPVRRHDIDGIFVAADEQQGRLIRPQLRFFDAGDIPAFATSRIYTGRPDPARNQDLDGFNLPLTSWQFEHPSLDSLPQLESLRQGELAPLFAIGMDAWKLLPWINLMRNDPDFRFPGQTGSISLNDTSMFVREPRWGRFARGIPVPESEAVNTPRFSQN